MSYGKSRSIESSSKLPLTARQREALEYIRRCVRKRGYGPTVREIGDQMGIHSPNGVVGHLTALERKGFIQREANLSRSIMLVDRGEKGLSGLPVLSSLLDGRLVENSDPEERLEVHEKIQISGDDFFLIRVLDQSLYSAYSFCRGDLLLVRRARNAGLGETVILRDFENEFTLAQCERSPEGDRLILRSSARWYENSCSGIYGVLVSVMRFGFQLER
ncbi:MAG: hypothetical protein J6A23_02685 [Thermoguttaceae bacterium]|nr:hypothetical protein [Thermoguttaceae bacterium]